MCIYNIHAIWVAFWAPRNSGIARGDAAVGKQVDEEGLDFFHESMDWLKGKSSPETHGFFFHQI